jgi:hypothetical protein
MQVKPGRNHRRVGHGLDSTEPFCDGPFLRVGFRPFLPNSLPLSRFLESLQSDEIGDKRAGLPGSEVGRIDSASDPLRLVKISTAAYGLSPHFYPTPFPTPRFED